AVRGRPVGTQTRGVARRPLRARIARRGALVRIAEERRGARVAGRARDRRAGAVRTRGRVEAGAAVAVSGGVAVGVGHRVAAGRALVVGVEARGARALAADRRRGAGALARRDQRALRPGRRGRRASADAGARRRRELADEGRRGRRRRGRRRGRGRRVDDDLLRRGTDHLWLADRHVLLGAELVAQDHLGALREGCELRAVAVGAGLRLHLVALEVGERGCRNRVRRAERRGARAVLAAALLRREAEHHRLELEDELPAELVVHLQERRLRRRADERRVLDLVALQVVARRVVRGRAGGAGGDLRAGGACER